jgi:alkanesulfonate monooxygenase SsuD/methylene tetrahydromethanopterin reductase-like flavin-dependent oxidoreductase (luciferase family)
MDFGIVLQNDPPAARVIDLCKRAETYGFTHAWTFDSHLLWEEPYVVYSRILNETHKLVVGPMVTNPATRDWTVTASLFATLNEMYGNRTICGIGRGDSAVRVINGRPVSVADMYASIAVIRGLANGEAVEYKGNTLRLPWNTGSRLPVWVAAYGPKMLALTGEVGDAAPAYVTDGTPEGLAYGRDQCRWFGGMVGNHVADIVARYGGDGSAVPAALTDYIAEREGYDYNEHGRAGNTHTAFVPDSIIDRFCLIGPPEHQVERLEELAALGVDQFALYLQHDAKDATLAAYGERVIPAVAQRVTAKT